MYNGDRQHRSMIGENQQLVTMNRLSLRNNRLKFKIAGKLPIILEDSIKYTLFQESKTGGCEHVTGWTCKN